MLVSVLVIYAHPDPESFNHAIYEQVVRGLKDKGQSYDVIDLYKEGFDPVLVHNQEKKRSEMKNDPELATYRRLIKEADHLIFIYPIWWSGMPAILKGFIDRVFASGFAYTFNKNIPVGLLKGKSSTVIYTLDSPGFYERLVRHNLEWQSVKGPILHFCGIRPVRRFVFFGVRTSSEQKRKKWLENIYQVSRK